jgi:hypothetical protein
MIANKTTAMQRAWHYFHEVPGRDVPPLAIEYANHLAHQFGVCGELVLTAMAHYAQCVEGLPCGDGLYRADEDARKWFAAHA